MPQRRLLGMAIEPERTWGGQRDQGSRHAFRLWVPLSLVHDGDNRHAHLLRYIRANPCGKGSRWDRLASIRRRFHELSSRLLTSLLEDGILGPDASRTHRSGRGRFQLPNEHGAGSGGTGPVDPVDREHDRLWIDDELERLWLRCRRRRSPVGRDNYARRRLVDGRWFEHPLQQLYRESGGNL